jgi:hypothetical protein
MGGCFRQQWPQALQFGFFLLGRLSLPLGRVWRLFSEISINRLPFNPSGAPFAAIAPASAAARSATRSSLWLTSRILFRFFCSKACSSALLWAAMPGLTWIFSSAKRFTKSRSCLSRSGRAVGEGGSGAFPRTACSIAGVGASTSAVRRCRGVTALPDSDANLAADSNNARLDAERWIVTPMWGVSPFPSCLRNLRRAPVLSMPHF